MKVQFSIYNFLLYNICTMVLGVLYAWSVFAAPLQELFPMWSKSQLSLCFSISLISFCLFGLVAGHFIKKERKTMLLLISGAMLFGGFYSVSFLSANYPMGSLYLLYMCYGVLCGGGVGIGYLSMIDTVGRISEKHKAALIGIVQMSFGLGGLILGAAIAELANTWGLIGVFRVLAILGISVLLLSAVLSSQHTKEKPDVDKGLQIEESFTTTEMLCTPTFWMFFLWNTLLAASGLIVINSATQIAGTFGLPILMGLLVSVCNSIGRLAFGYCYDRWALRLVMFMASLVMLLAGCMLYSASSRTLGTLAVGGLLFTGIAYGASPITSVAFLQNTYGNHYFSKNFSVSNFNLIPASLLGPYLSGILQREAVEKGEGAFSAMFAVIVVFSLLTLLLNVFIHRSAKALAAKRLKDSESKTNVPLETKA